MARGLVDYFPDALAEVSHVSHQATQQHHPDKEMHWDRSKSNDHADCIMRHLIGRGTTDTDGMLHSAKLAWRALALLQIELEEPDEKQKILYANKCINELLPIVLLNMKKIREARGD